MRRPGWPRSTGAKLAWVPRRAGERGAVDAGALPNLLPGGRPVDDAAARAEVERVWGTEVPAETGRDADAILRAAVDGSLAALVVGGVDPVDFADPALAAEALERAGFIVSLEIRASAVTAAADVVLPVAPAAEKAGRFVTWEGRRRPFDLTITNTGAMSDGRVLHALAEELDVDFGLPTVGAARAELLQLSLGMHRPARTECRGHRTGDAGSGPGPAGHLARTDRRRSHAGRRRAPGRHGQAGPRRAQRGHRGRGRCRRGRLGQRRHRTRRARAARGHRRAPDRVVWLPTNARECAVRATLGADSGALVTLTSADAPPVVGADPEAAAGGGS